VPANAHNNGSGGPQKVEQYQEEYTGGKGAPDCSLDATHNGLRSIQKETMKGIRCMQAV
jgi:hypothetical protein